MILQLRNPRQVNSGQSSRIMSRKSARLLSKSKPQTCDTESDEYQPKRRRLTDVKLEEFGCTIKRQQFRIQNNRLPISPTHAVTSAMIVPDEVDSLACGETLSLPTPVSVCEEEDEVVHVVTNSVKPRRLFRFSNHFSRNFTQMVNSASTPLPKLDWARSQDVWKVMKTKEERYSHSMDMFSRHPAIKPTYRAVLYTWLTEVCEVYKLHRETFYYTVEYVDRFLMQTTEIPTDKLQLVGVTALFIASKLEEIYPPKCSEYAYVSDKAFEEMDIQQFELFMMKKLDWLLNPMTPTMWLQLYLQTAKAQELQRLPPCPSPSPSSSRSSTLDLDSSDSSSLTDLVTSAEGMDLQAPDSAPLAVSSALLTPRCLNDCPDRLGCQLGVCVPAPAKTAGGERSRTDSECVVVRRPGTDLDYDTESSNERDDDEEEEEEECSYADVRYPIYSSQDYLKASRLLDLAILDSYSLKFPYSQLAAAALYLAVDVHSITRATWFSWAELRPCVEWMTIHKNLLDKHLPHWKLASVKSFDGVAENVAHRIQDHIISRDMWESAQRHSEEYFNGLQVLATAAEKASPSLASTFITPPRSCRKDSPQTTLR